MKENVVCVPSMTIPDGVFMSGDPYFLELLRHLEESRVVKVRDTEDKSPLALENDREWRQLVTYILVQDDRNVFIYKRTKGTGEKRLAGKYALAGGHMNSHTQSFIQDLISDTMRELNEEFKLTPKGEKTFFKSDKEPLPLTVKPQAIIQNSCNEDGSGVQLVHTGIVMRVDLNGNYDVELRDTSSMVDLTQVNATNYDEYLEPSELWLRMLLPFLDQLTRHQIGA